MAASTASSASTAAGTGAVRDATVLEGFTARFTALVVVPLDWRRNRLKDSTIMATGPPHTYNGGKTLAVGVHVRANDNHMGPPFGAARPEVKVRQSVAVFRQQTMDEDTLAPHPPGRPACRDVRPHLGREILPVDVHKVWVVAVVLADGRRPGSRETKKKASLGRTQHLHRSTDDQVDLHTHRRTTVDGRVTGGRSTTHDSRNAGRRKAATHARKVVTSCMWERASSWRRRGTRRT